MPKNVFVGLRTNPNICTMKLDFGPLDAGHWTHGHWTHGLWTHGRWTLDNPNLFLQDDESNLTLTELKSSV